MAKSSPAVLLEAMSWWERTKLNLSFSRFRNRANWETFDLRRLGEEVWGYAESVFDGRYVYYGTQRTYGERPGDGAHCRMLRFDTEGSFSDLSAWEVFDATQVAGKTGSFEALAFDGHFAYFGPYFTGPELEVQPFHIALRFDTSRPFSDPGAWSRFDTSVIDDELYGYCGGRGSNAAVYFAPYNTGIGNRSLFLRHKTGGNFGSPSSWEVFDSTSVILEAKGYNGVEYDGRYVYSAPCFNNHTNRTNTWMVRYDSHGDFTDRSAWQFFNLAAALGNPALGGYHGSMISDGRYIYYVPLYAPRPCEVENINHGWFTRFDTQGQFNDPAAWQVFNTRSLRNDICGYSGAGFDGRFIYLCPVRCCEHVNHGRMLRYDTWKRFDSRDAYDIFDAATIDKRLIYFDGQISFDGNYLYYPAPTANSMMVRFRSRSKWASLFKSAAVG